MALTGFSGSVSRTNSPMRMALETVLTCSLARPQKLRRCVVSPGVQEQLGSSQGLPIPWFERRTSVAQLVSGRLSAAPARAATLGLGNF